VWGWVDDDLAFLRPWGFELTEISVPVEIRYGVQDVLVPAQHGRWLGENVPTASVVVEAGEGHLTDPATVLDLLRSLTAPA
jgi:pimeloyl-ACP methyl ester carboxylesterase